MVSMATSADNKYLSAAGSRPVVSVVARGAKFWRRISFVLLDLAKSHFTR